jgi:hypothetical protein
MPVNCYHICSYCYANNSTKDDIHPTSAAPSVTVDPMLAPSSPLQWLPRCRRHRRHCHCCCHLPLPWLCRRLRRHHFRAIATTFWLIVVCPCAASLLLPPLPNPAVAAGGCQHHCHSAAANGCLLLLPPQPLPQFQPLFSLVMFKILHKPSNILNIFTATFWLIVVYPHLSLLLPPLPAPTVARLPTSSS